MDAVRAQPVYVGKRLRRLDDLFTIEGEPGDELEVRIGGGQVKWIGRGMTRGRIVVRGTAGMHLGAAMKGGSIEVHGDAGDWVGAEMSGGTIHVRGNAGGQIGAAYRGSMTGMRGGTVVVDGSAGIEIGMRMRRGVITVRGPVRDFAGLQMKGGTIFLLGGAEIRTGAWMTRGTIVSLAPVRLLPTFAYACDYEPSFLRLYERHLRGFGVGLPGDGAYRRYAGDAAIPGKGEILVWRSRSA
jgi:formylmethanofuran dehydrogenase subunit C